MLSCCSLNCSCRIKCWRNHRRRPKRTKCKTEAVWFGTWRKFKRVAYLGSIWSFFPVCRGQTGCGAPPAGGPYPGGKVTCGLRSHSQLVSTLQSGMPHSMRRATVSCSSVAPYSVLPHTEIIGRETDSFLRAPLVVRCFRRGGCTLKF
jgi:hypothetical protein